jgi:Uma2 family endonuclease
MAGETYEHSVIILNVAGKLRQGLKRVNCTVSSSNARLAIGATNLYTYPDVMVVCGDPVFVGTGRDTVANPVLIIEVLSDATSGYDRGEKFQSYRVIDSLKEYLMVAQDKIRLEQYVRQADKRWLLIEYSQLQDRIQLASVGLELQLSDIYEKIKFEEK